MNERIHGNAGPIVGVSMRWILGHAGRLRGGRNCDDLPRSPAVFGCHPFEARPEGCSGREAGGGGMQTPQVCSFVHFIVFHHKLRVWGGGPGGFLARGHGVGLFAFGGTY